MSNLSGKVALITGTGAKTGIGRAISLRLARDGADIVVTDIAPRKDPVNEKKPEETWGLGHLADEIKAMGRKAFAVMADLRDNRQVKSMVEKAWNEYGAIDIVVNNAGVTASGVGRKLVVSLDQETWNTQMDVNLTAPFLISKLVGSKMIERGKGGKIINISSIAGKIGRVGGAGYCASKFGLIGLTQTLALELGEYNINVNAVCPSAILTWMGRGTKIRKFISEGLTTEEAVKKTYSDLLPFMALKRLGTTDDVANIVSFLAGSESDFITGQAINVDGGFVMH